MALSQAQKNFVTLLAQNPQAAFKKIQDQEIDLNSYKNCFYKDGTSLLHILINGVITTSHVHLPIITYVLENSNLSLEDKATSKVSAIEFYQDYYKDYLYNDYMAQGLPFVKNFYNLIKASGNKNAVSSIYLCACNLKKYSLDIEYEDLLPQLKDKYNSAGNIIRQIILRDDIKALEEWFILNPKSKDYFLEQNFFLGDGKINTHNQEIVSGLRDKDEKSNALIFAIYKNAHKISPYIIDNNLLPLTGIIEKYEFYENVKSKSISVCALSQCVSSNNYELYEKIFYQLSKESLSEIFTTVEKILSKHPSTDLLDIVLNHSDIKFKNLIIQNAKDIMQFAKQPIHVLYSIISSSSSIENISNMLDNFLPYFDISKFPTKPPYTSFANRFFSNVTNRVNISDKQYALISQSVYNLKNAGLLLYETHMVFRPTFFSDEKLFDCLVNGGLDLKNTSVLLNNNSEQQKPINLLQIAVKLRTGVGSYNATEITNHNPKVLKKIKNMIGENALITNGPTKDLIISHSIIVNKYDILDLYSNEEIKQLIKIDKQFIKSWYNVTETKKFESFIHRCIDSDIIFCDNITVETPQGILKYDPLFYALLAYDTDINILDKILNKENKTINEFSKDPNFWNHITSKEIAQYVKNNGADYNNSEIILSLCQNLNLNTIDLYLKYGGNINYKDNNQDPLLHILVKGGYYKPANLLLEYYPELNSVVNRQNKFAVSYILEDLNKKCKDPSKIMSQPNKNEFMDIVDLTCNMFSNGFEQSNKKPVEFLKTQLAKYEAIFTYKPELKNMFQYGLLQNKIIHKQTNSIQKKKI